MKEVHFKMDFSAVDGCPEGVLLDMLRYDGQRLVCGRRDGQGYRWVVLGAEPVKSEEDWRYGGPTMDRWDSFAVGARLSDVRYVEI